MGWVEEEEDDRHVCTAEPLNATESTLLNIKGRMRAGHPHVSPPGGQTGDSQSCFANDLWNCLSIALAPGRSVVLTPLADPVEWVEELWLGEVLGAEV